METRTVNYKDYVITTKEGVEKGLFFRSPIQKRTIMTYFDMSEMDQKYIEKIRNPGTIRRFFERLLGNGEVLKNLDNYLNDIDCAGFDIKYICSPIYFKRESRHLTAVCTNPKKNIQKIVSHGYEDQYNICGGDCHVEKTIITTKTRSKIRIKKKEQYEYTYAHIVKRTIDTDVFQR